MVRSGHSAPPDRASPAGRARQYARPSVQVFERIGGEGYEQVVFCQEGPSGLRAVIAVHSTRLGPALGGARFRPYGSEDEAVEDVLRLARQMTYKSAVAGLDLGGGKAVILGDPAELRSEALLRAFGRFVDSLGGRYLTAEDVGTTQADMDLLRSVTPFVTGVSRAMGGSGDPSLATAHGVQRAMEAAAAHLWGGPALAGRHVVVSGAGKVGAALAGRLAAAGARVTVSDVDPDRADRVAAACAGEVVDPAKAHAVECDVFSPCALGGVLTATSIDELRCAAVVGSANNQLADPSGPDRLAEAGVTYVPDYVASAGGVVNIAEELRGYDPARAAAAVDRIFDTTTAVLAAAEAAGETTVAAADRLAERRLATGPGRGA